MFANFDLKRLKRFDGYRKPVEDLRIRTLSGGCVTLVTSIIMALLFFNELRYYMTTRVKQELYVDALHEDKIRVYMDIVFPRMGCAYLTLDTMSTTGELQLSADHELYHTRLDEKGRPIGPAEKHSSSVPPELAAKRAKTGYCGSCYGAEVSPKACCNTCDEVRSAYQSKGWILSDLAAIEQCREEGMPSLLDAAATEGCRFNGSVVVEKVVGNMHFAPGRSYQAGAGNVHVHDVGSLHSKKYNLSHVIVKLAFGENYPTMVNPLDGSIVYSEEDSMRYSYHVKVVPTKYIRLDGTVFDSNQFSVTKDRRATGLGGGVPGLFINYEFSPISVRLSEYRNSFLHFVTSVCAIVGGVFTVSSLIDSGIYQLSMLKKNQ